MEIVDTDSEVPGLSQNWGRFLTKLGAGAAAPAFTIGGSGAVGHALADTVIGAEDGAVDHP